MLRTTSGLFASSAVVLGGVAGSTVGAGHSVAETPLIGPTWAYAGSTNAAGEFTPYTLSPASIQIAVEPDGTRISGNDGCNNVMGALPTVDATTISFGPIASTMMACLVPGATVDFAAALSETRTYAITDALLTLTDPATSVSWTFTEATVVTPAG